MIYATLMMIQTRIHTLIVWELTKKNSAIDLIFCPIWQPVQTEHMKLVIYCILLKKEVLKSNM